MGRCSSDSEEDSANISFNFNEGAASKEGSGAASAPQKESGGASRTANAILCGQFVAYDDERPRLSPSLEIQTWKREASGPAAHSLKLRWGGAGQLHQRGHSGECQCGEKGPDNRQLERRRARGGAQILQAECRCF